MSLDLSNLLSEAVSDIAGAADRRELDAVRVKYLGKKGLLTDQLKALSSLSREDKPEAGKAVNIACLLYTSRCV